MQTGNPQVMQHLLGWLLVLHLMFGPKVKVKQNAPEKQFETTSVPSQNTSLSLLSVRLVNQNFPQDSINLYLPTICGLLCIKGGRVL